MPLRYTSDEVGALLTRLWNPVTVGSTFRMTDPALQRTASSIGPESVYRIETRLIDVEQGLKNASLTEKEMQAVYMRHGEDQGFATIAAELGVSNSVVQKRVANGVRKIATFLNGGEA